MSGVDKVSVWTEHVREPLKGTEGLGSTVCLDTLLLPM